MTTAILKQNTIESFIDPCLALYGFPLEISTIVSDYVLRRPELFGAAEYLKYFGIKIGNPVLCAEFFSFWNSYDAFDVYQNSPNPRFNYETHFDPIYRPIGMNVDTLSEHVANPLNGGHPTKILRMGDAFKHSAHTSAEHGAWLVPRKGVVARNRLYDQQKEFLDDVNKRTRAKYERENDLIDLVTCAAVGYVFKEERLLTGEGGRLTLARCKDIACYEGSTYRSTVVNSAPSSLTIYANSDTASEEHGVLALRKFKDG